MTTPSSKRTSSSKLAFRASWVCPISQPPIRDGIVAAENGQIQFVGPFKDFDLTGFQVQDLGNGAVIPGLVNAHTHLEFSDLEYPLGNPGIGFTDWIRLIVKSRMESIDQTGKKKQNAIAAGIKESIESGVVAIGEIATAPIDPKDYTPDFDDQLRRRLSKVVVFLEQLGSDVETFDEKGRELKQFFESEIESSRILYGASPHAPYSCHWDLLDQICVTAKQHSAQNSTQQQTLVAMHLAETRQERELLDHQAGEFVELLKDFGVWNPSAFDSSRNIKAIIEQLSNVKSLLVHGNYLSDSELDLVSRHREKMSIVFCPRTHSYFEHSKYPLTEMLERSIRVAVGTDSRASNPDLNLFNDLKLIAKSFPNLPVDEILKLGTANGAEALGLNQLGTLAPGKSDRVNFIAQPVSIGSDVSLDQWIWNEDSTCRPLC